MTSNEPNPAGHRISRLGSTAARILGKPCKGNVAAVFDRSIYCLVEGEYVCIGVQSLGMCPLNVITSIPVSGGVWSSYSFHTGMPVFVYPDHVRIGGRFNLKLNGAPIWSPSLSSDLDYVRIKGGLAALDAQVPKRVPADGLGRLMLSTVQGAAPFSDLQNYALGPLDRLRHWLSMALCDPQGNVDPDIPTWQNLLGLGPGLTPSGDDLVGGMMLALCRLGQMSNLRTLSTAVAEVVETQTNPISAAHLRSAMNGTGNEAVHRILDVLFSGNSRDLPDALEGIDKVGHTSGWDTLAGIVIVLRLWLESNWKRVATPE